VRRTGDGEICSVYPTAGGLYFWAGRLARRNKAVWAWYVGWFNFLGEVAVTAAIDYGAALTWTAVANLVWGFEVTPVRTFLVFTVILLAHGLLNTFGVNLVKLLSNVSAWWHLGGVAVIVGVLAHHRRLRHPALIWIYERPGHLRTTWTSTNDMDIYERHGDLRTRWRTAAVAGRSSGSPATSSRPYEAYGPACRTPCCLTPTSRRSRAPAASLS